MEDIEAYGQLRDRPIPVPGAPPPKAGATAPQAAVTNAARKCKAERKTMGDAPFKAKYGTTADKSNAFGKCVSKLAAAQQQG